VLVSKVLNVFAKDTANDFSDVDSISIDSYDK